MKKKLLTGLLVVFTGWVLLILARFLYLELAYSTEERAGVSGAGAQIFDSNIRSFEFSSKEAPNVYKRNYASAVFVQQAAVQAIEQKYEKVAQLDTVSKDFTSDERKARETVTKQHGIVQEEQSKVSDHSHALRLTIGVPPENFDQAVGMLQSIGENVRLEITKADKTNEFLELRAKRTSLEKTRDALTGLKDRGGKVEELIELEKEILELESDIQGLGVQLGQFDKENQFCTIRFSLLETRVAPQRSHHLETLMSAIEWASQAYLVVLAIVFAGLLCVVLALIGLEKAKLFQTGN